MDIFQILREAFDLGASDIHISTTEVPIFRIHGEMVRQSKYSELSLTESQNLIAQILNDNQKQNFMIEKDFDFAIDIPKLARFRVNTFFTTKGINAVFRIIPNEIITFDELNLPTTLKKILKLKKGLILITGPTGSGKSTTLASIIDIFNKTLPKHILTIEDPIEFVHKSDMSIVTHREIGKHTKNFGSALRAVTRQDPDIILVGEMRDLETISLALTAAEMGSLVFATLHTSSASKTINRIVDVFPEKQQNQIRFMLAETLEYVVSQVLLKKNDGGRVAALEILVSTDGVKNMIRNGDTHQIPAAISGGKKENMQSMDFSLEQLLSSGQVSYDEAKVHIVSESLADKYKNMANSSKVAIPINDDNNLNNINNDFNIDGLEIISEE